MEVLKYGNLTLKKISEEVTTFDDELIKIADKMYETMINEKGIGLAAPQVGLLIRLIVIEVEEGKEQTKLELVNPQVVYFSPEKVLADEGCLSVPDVFAKVERPEAVIVKARNLRGEMIEFEAGGLFARVIQHEIDHLDGVLFVDRISDVDKKALKSELKKIKKKYNKVLI